MAAEEIIEYRVRSLESSVSKIEMSVASIDRSLQELAKLEANHAETCDSLERAFSSIERNRADYEASCEKVDDRIRVIELQMPILKMTSRWIIGGTIGIVSGSFATFGMVVYALLPILAK